MPLSGSSSIIILVILIISIIAFFIFYFSKKQVIIRTLKKIPNTKIGNVQTNRLTKITGKAQTIKEPLIAPYSKRNCVFFTIKIEQENGDDENSYWETLVYEEKIQSFMIKNNEDLIMVNPIQNPKNYKSHLVVDTKVSSGTFNNPSPKFESLLKQYDIKSTGLFGFNKSLRYTEAIIELGEEITVAGICEWKSLDKPIPGYSYSKIASLKSDQKQKLIITDLPKERIIRKP